jgi:hypothetical protein
MTTLLELTQDSLCHVMGFLDSVDLSRLECVSREAHRLATLHGWHILAQRDLKGPQPSQLSAKKLMIRWTVASTYAAKIEMPLERNEYHPILRDGVNAWTCGDPDRNHDYFLRLSDEKFCHWEGFVPEVLMEANYLHRMSFDDRHRYGLDLGTLWNEEQFGWYTKFSQALEEHPVHHMYSQAQGSGRTELDEPTEEECALLRDYCLLLKKTFR